MPTLPFGIGKHSNRSQHGLDEAAAQRERASASQSNLNSAALDESTYDARATQQQYTTSRSDIQGGQQYLNNVPPIDPRFHDQADTPSRSQSQRYSTGYPQQLNSDGRQLPADEASNPANVQKSYSISGANPRLSQQAPPEKEKKSRAKGFFGGFSKSKDKAEPAPAQSSDYNNLGGVGRKASKSSKTAPPALQQRAQQVQPGYSQFSQQGSETHLPSPQEGDEEDRDRDHRYQQNPESFQETTEHQQNYDPRLHPSIRIGRSEQDPSIRSVEDSPTSHLQYQQQQQFLLQQQRQAQQQHAPISAEDPHEGDYPPSLHGAQYQNQQQPAGQLYTNIPYRSTQNPEVVSQLSRESPTDGQGDQRPPSSATQPPGVYPSSPADYSSRAESLQERRSEQQSEMAPPPGNNQNRRSTDAKAQLGAGESRGPPPGYAQQFPGQGSSQNAAGAAPLPPTPGSRPSGLRGEYVQSGAEQGRSTPPLPTERSGDAAELEKLVVKYKKVKGLYFEKNAQVEQLQNTLAIQRLSQSRTSLDDNEYATRFNRLDGAIKEIAFSIRKDWRVIPLWLQPYVNADAQKAGTKEMTAIGRASISKWIYDEIFCKCFVPGLDLGLSADLKRMEQNIRKFASPPTNLEEENALTSKVIQWKLTTIDALTDRLMGPDALDTKVNYTRMAVSNLTAHLMQHLVEPAPEGIEGNATSIIELAISICMHLPKESREIAITFPLPGEMVQATGMKVETGLPPLENPMAEVDGETNSTSSGDKDEDDKGAKLRKKKDDTKLTPRKKSIEKNDNKIRFAAFMGVEVKGRQWLVNAPVWTLG